MLKGIIIAADGCEDTEIVATRDILLRTREIEVDLVTLNDTKEFTTSHGLRIKADKSIGEVMADGYGFIVLPGGKAGVDNIIASEKALELVKEFHRKGKVLGAICAAPSILGKLGLLEGVSYVCFPGFEAEGGILKSEASAVIDGKIVTGRSMYYSVSFGEALVRALLGKEAADALYGSIRGLR